MSPKSLHRLAAGLEMTTWTLLILAMVAKYSGLTEALVPIAGPIHGFGFLCFVVLTIVLWVNNRWSPGVGLIGLIVSVIPFGALPFTYWVDKKGLLDGPWRFADRSETPRSIPDHALAQLVRHPIRTITLILVGVIIVFSVLLAMGPPYDPNAI
ncbi:DUF3817 domain-containing protein [Corynebacterium tapiri]|uniref:DUF3817 domain-containing protein n=1 Tax=Corynebacterium tapiri TaxID=1448266 RepID=A0A5C4U3R9_9CORY|nr:DUF3817 domain-containing protein [Corynebacterium tapiri]TNL97741.1 DUF3817 domain-containing protein [Corynebacterium tapiri]